MKEKDPGQNTTQAPEAPQTRSDIARIIGIEDKTLVYYLYRYEIETRKSLYSIYHIPKRDGTNREIMAPIEPLKHIQRKLADYLNTIYIPKPNVYGFVCGKSTIDGAQQHVKSKLLLNIDLQDFFGTINFGRIRGMFIKKPYEYGKKAATTIAQVACRNNRLPQGAPCSPVLANMICSHLDTALIRFAYKYHLIYTRYADDITLSTTSNVGDFQKSIVYRDENEKLHVGVELDNLIRKCGFTINPKKIYVQSIQQRQLVTGIVVNRRTSVPREYAKLTRALLFRCRKDGVEFAARHYISKVGVHYRVPQEAGTYLAEKLLPWFEAVLTGRVAYIGAVKGKDDSIYLRLAHECNELFGREIFKNLPDSNDLQNLSREVFVIECLSGDDLYQGSGFYIRGVGILTCYHCLRRTIELGDCACIYSVDENGYKRSLTRVNRDDVLKYDREKDYAIIRYEASTNVPSFSKQSISLGRNFAGKSVRLLGHPEYADGNTIQILDTQITQSIGEVLGSMLYRVSNPVVHGMSGGPVLDEQNKVIGIIKGGLSTTDESSYGLPSGFIPISYAVPN